jgi:hypothetical protein
LWKDWYGIDLSAPEYMLPGLTPHDPPELRNMYTVSYSLFSFDLHPTILVFQPRYLHEPTSIYST